MEQDETMAAYIWRAVTKYLVQTPGLLGESQKALVTAHRQEMSTPALASDYIRQCQARFTHDKSKILVTIVASHAVHPILRIIFETMIAQGAKIRHGSAPALGDERELRSLLREAR
eukprot:TRINITY_DN17582_c0_g1_i1.p1 TRINITY_DN17582_c0_g1~~TRINITY_DN17582_c0_g1_i1.p1  ORF type:complete len:116 (+),score=18.57 TRINITY_DN17582_c0_g1_i1:160-507(+)